MVVRIGALDRVADHHDELGVGHHACTALGRQRVEEVVGAALAGESLGAAWELSLIPLVAGGVIEIEVVQFLASCWGYLRVLDEVRIERRSSAALGSDDDEIG